MKMVREKKVAMTMVRRVKVTAMRIMPIMMSMKMLILMLTMTTRTTAATMEMANTTMTRRNRTATTTESMMMMIAVTIVPTMINLQSMMPKVSIVISMKKDDHGGVDDGGYDGDEAIVR